MAKKMKLLPCPFCGGDADIKMGKYGGSAKWVYSIQCVEGCIVMSDLYGPEKDAVKRWNTRI